MNTESQRRRVTRAIKLALARIAEKDPELASLLREAIQTGTYLSYTSVMPQPAPQRMRAKTAPLSGKSPIRH